MNEIIFLVHTTFITAATIVALKLGKETLITLISIFCILANLFVTKQICLFGLHPTASEGFAVGAIVGLNLLQEHFGKAIAKKAVWICFFSLIFYTIASQIHLLYQPSIFDCTQIHFLSLLRSMPRITAASIIVTVIVQHFDRLFYGFLKNRYANRSFLFRNQISVALSLFIDTALFTYLGLYGIVSKPWQILFFSYTVKLAASLLITPLLSVVKPENHTS